MGKIYFGGSLKYNVQVYNVFDRITSNPAGAGIVTLIRRTERDLTIIPFADNICDARTSSENAADAADGAPAGVSNKWPAKMDDGEYQGARWFHGKPDDPLTRNIDEREDPVQGRRMGTGRGGNATIKYTPYIYGEAWCHPDGKYGSKSDEVLFHEMVHALRKMQGKYNQIPTGDSFTGYHDEEEFLAITATNVYLSAKGVGNDGLRGGHDGHYPLRPPLNTSAGFLADSTNRKLMNIYRLVWAEAFLGLALVSQARFNPFRELIHQNG